MSFSGSNLIPKALRPGGGLRVNLGGLGGPVAPNVDWEALGRLLAGGDQPPPDYGGDPGYDPGYYDGGGDSGGGVVYMQAPSLPPYDPNNDPSYQALLAQLGLSESQARNQADVTKQQAFAQAATAVPRIQEAGIEQRRNIGINAEQHGMFRSGARLRDLSLQQRAENQKLADTYTSLVNRQANVDLGLQGKLNDIANQRVQAGFEAKLRQAS